MIYHSVNLTGVLGPFARPLLLVRYEVFAMNRRVVISALSLAPFTYAATTPGAERKKFIGVWKLTSGVAKHEVTGAFRYPWGKNPVGSLSYDQPGRLFPQLLNPRRPPLAGAPP